MTDIELNEPLLRKTFEYIAEHPLEWDQRHWASCDISGHIITTHKAKQETQAQMLNSKACGTTMCFAGTAIWLDGAEFADAYDVVKADGTYTQIADAAQKALGLHPDQADEIFNTFTANIDTMRRTIEKATGVKL